MSRKGGLGRGLDALIPGESTPQPAVDEAAVPALSGTIQARVEEIIPNPRQPRFIMDAENLEELAASIREHGILQPLIVTREPGNEHYILIAGERRLRAAKLAGLETVPVILRQVTDQERLELALIENVQRADLNSLETAEAYRQLVEEFNLSHDQVAQRVGKSRTAVTNTLRLLKLSSAVQTALAEGRISEGHARALVELSPQAQQAVLQLVLHAELNVRQTEALANKYKGQKPAPVIREVEPEIKALEERLRDHLGTRVTLHHGKRGGSLVIHYFSDEELGSLISQILKD